MSEPASSPEPNELETFDMLPDGRLACRVCGELAVRKVEYARTLWDWHEAANGA
jgi:hypothetical protein